MCSILFFEYFFLGVTSNTKIFFPGNQNLFTCNNSFTPKYPECNPPEKMVLDTSYPDYIQQTYDDTFKSETAMDTTSLPEFTNSSQQYLGFIRQQPTITFTDTNNSAIARYTCSNEIQSRPVEDAADCTFCYPNSETTPLKSILRTPLLRIPPDYRSKVQEYCRNTRVTFDLAYNSYPKDTVTNYPVEGMNETSIPCSQTNQQQNYDHNDFQRDPLFSYPKSSVPPSSFGEYRPYHYLQINSQNIPQENSTSGYTGHSLIHADIFGQQKNPAFQHNQPQNCQDNVSLDRLENSMDVRVPIRNAYGISNFVSQPMCHVSSIAIHLPATRQFQKETIHLPAGSGSYMIPTQTSAGLSNNQNCIRTGEDLAHFHRDRFEVRTNK